LISVPNGSVLTFAEPWRGFSGDGLLSEIATSGGAAAMTQLNWQDKIDVPPP
jgi:hypothetical protein